MARRRGGRGFLRWVTRTKATHSSRTTKNTKASAAAAKVQHTTIIALLPGGVSHCQVRRRAPPPRPRTAATKT
eukprot:1176489-Prorocentrum_minimum.AAC.3